MMKLVKSTYFLFVLVGALAASTAQAYYYTPSYGGYYPYGGTLYTTTTHTTTTNYGYPYLYQPYGYGGGYGGYYPGYMPYYPVVTPYYGGSYGYGGGCIFGFCASGYGSSYGPYKSWGFSFGLGGFY